ncbi:Alanine dehydrogenase [subsurface metagenome]
MIIGIPKEIKIGETRVAITPEELKEFVKQGHKVLIESVAGEKSGFSDTDYEATGGIIVGKEELFSDAELILKIKQPYAEEMPYFREDQTLFTYLHLDGNAPREYTEELLKLGICAIAYEWVEKEDGTHPLLIPMSEITGNLVAQIGLELLTYPNGEKGIFAGGIEGLDPARVTIIGGGIIGCNAANYALRVGTKVTLVDKHPWDLSERLKRYVPAHLVEVVDGVESDESNIRSLLPQTDLLINCAVRRPDFKEPHLITREMLKLMEKGSILIDATASDHDMVETCKVTSHLEPTFVVDGIIHYCVDNVPAAVPRTSTLALTSKTLPYALEIANKGFWRAVSENEELAKGVMFVKDKIVSKLIADLKEFDYYPLHTVRR